MIGYMNAKRQITAGWLEAFGTTWESAHPGKTPTTEVQPVSEQVLRRHYDSRGPVRTPPNGCSMARWRAYCCVRADPMRFENGEQA